MFACLFICTFHNSFVACCTFFVIQTLNMKNLGKNQYGNYWSANDSNIWNVFADGSTSKESDYFMLGNNNKLIYNCSASAASCEEDEIYMYNSTIEYDTNDGAISENHQIYLYNMSMLNYSLSGEKSEEKRSTFYGLDAKYVEFNIKSGTLSNTEIQCPNNSLTDGVSCVINYENAAIADFNHFRAFDGIPTVLFQKFLCKDKNNNIAQNFLVTFFVVL